MYSLLAMVDEKEPVCLQNIVTQARHLTTAPDAEQSKALFAHQSLASHWPVMIIRCWPLGHFCTGIPRNYSLVFSTGSTLSRESFGGGGLPERIK